MDEEEKRKLYWPKELTAEGIQSIAGMAITPSGFDDTLEDEYASLILSGARCFVDVPPPDDLCWRACFLTQGWLRYGFPVRRAAHLLPQRQSLRLASHPLRDGYLPAPPSAVKLYSDI